jgi:hypothetical protein
MPIPTPKNIPEFAVWPINPEIWISKDYLLSPCFKDFQEKPSKMEVIRENTKVL